MLITANKNLKNKILLITAFKYLKNPGVVKKLLKMCLINFKNFKRL